MTPTKFLAQKLIEFFADEQGLEPDDFNSTFTPLVEWLQEHDGKWFNIFSEIKDMEDYDD